ncbi:hypothetical protein D3C75_795610 [compost metagenome]
MGNLRVGDQISHSRHDFGDARFVVGTQKRCAVSGDQSLALVAGKLRVSCYRQNGALCGVQYNVLTVVILNQLRVHISAAEVLGCVHMGQKTDDRHRGFVRIGRQGGHDVAVLVNRYLGHAQLLQLLHQLVGQGPLPFRGGAGVVMLVGLGI